VESLQVSHLPSAVALLERASLPGAVASVARYLRWQPDGAWASFIDGELAGMVTLLRFGHVGFIGCMAVDPARRSRGLGRTLLEHAHAAGRRAGITTFLLEATTSGEPLYEKLGYVTEHETCNLGREPAAASAAGSAADLADLSPERDAILALDREATGSSRAVMLSGLIAEHRGAVVQRGGLAGYALAVAGRLGPMIARDPDTGRALIDRVAPACTLASVPTDNAPAIAAFTAHGFAVTRTLRRMRLGPAIATPPGWLWALSSPGAG